MQRTDPRFFIQDTPTLNWYVLKAVTPKGKDICILNGTLRALEATKILLDKGAIAIRVRICTGYVDSEGNRDENLHYESYFVGGSVGIVGGSDV